jgi:hypothetical protein
MPATEGHLTTGDEALVRLAAVRMLRRHLGPGADVVSQPPGEMILCAYPDGGVARLRLFDPGDVLAWYAAVSRGPDFPGETLAEAMKRHDHLLRPF